LISVRGLKSGYGLAEVLHGIDLEIEDGMFTVILGPNGAGKTTLLKTIIGLVTRSAGSIAFDGQELGGKSPVSILRHGLSYVPQGGGIFPQMSVKENLEMGLYLSSANRDQKIKDALDLFPDLGGRLKQKAGFLSGGERQMLAVARSLMSDPRAVLLDEPSTGLDIGKQSILFERIKKLKEQGLTMFMAEQNVKAALGLADKAYIINAGKIVYSGDALKLSGDATISGFLSGNSIS
jgi:branched-chain amino acid transport system ATP-binding protein